MFSVSEPPSRRVIKSVLNKKFLISSFDNYDNRSDLGFLYSRTYVLLAVAGYHFHGPDVILSGTNIVKEK